MDIDTKYYQVIIQTKLKFPTGIFNRCMFKEPNGNNFN